nr:dna polymerase alpha catalytic subunit [Quercus suber]
MVIVVIHFPSTPTTLTLHVENGSLFFFFFVVITLCIREKRKAWPWSKPPSLKPSPSISDLNPQRARGPEATAHHEALERLKALRQGGSHRSESGAGVEFQIKLDKPIYDTVEEDEYDALVAKRREEARDFIVESSTTTASATVTRARKRTGPSPASLYRPAISYLLLSAASAGIGASKDLRPYIKKSNDHFNSYLSKGFAAANLLLPAFVCTMILSILSYYALPEKV